MQQYDIRPFTPYFVEQIDIVIASQDHAHILIVPANPC